MPHLWRTLQPTSRSTQGSSDPALRHATQPRPGRLVVAGGLTAASVGEAIDALSPDIVDVSSGVESSPGLKDHARIADFMEAVRQTGVFR